MDLNNPATPATIEAELLEAVEREFDLENSVKQKGRAWPVPQILRFSQIALIVNHLYVVRLIQCGGNTGSGGELLAIYQEDGINQGIYVTSDDVFRNICRQYNFQMSNREFVEIMTALRELAPRCSRCDDPDLVPVNNGIFDYRAKTLLPFSPEYVFLTKSRVNYNQNAVNQVLYNPDDKTSWDVESWVQELSDDPEIVNVLWEVMGAILRPNVPWNKSAWFYSETGNNGKGKPSVYRWRFGQTLPAPAEAELSRTGTDEAPRASPGVGPRLQTQWPGKLTFCNFSKQKCVSRTLIHRR